MSFLYNAWYCAGWSADLTENLSPITILNEPVLLYRKQNGAAVAIGNRCPHRFAPLHLGTKVGDCVQCPYHGLRFGDDGKCSHNPHGDGSIPKAAQVKRYPIVERHNAIWIWMGEPEKADPETIMDIHEVTERQGWTQVRGKLQIKANYELVSDNLLDLSHVPFLHPFLSFDGPPPGGFQVLTEMKHEGDVVYHNNTVLNIPVSPLFRALWGADQVEIGDMRSHMRWTPPSNLFLDVGMTRCGEPDDRDTPAIPIAHLLTPETENSTHYFWAQARNRHVGNDEFSAEMQKGITDVFVLEDEMIIEACQEMMGTHDLMSLRPVLLPGDSAAIRARRVLQGKIEAEKASK